MLQTDLNSWHFLKVVIQVPPTRQGAAQYLLWYDSKQVTNLCDITACKLLITFWSSPGEDYSSCTKLFANHKWKNSQSTSMHGDVLSGTVADIEMPKSNTNVNPQKRLFGILPSLQHESRVLMEQCSHPQNRT